jgi:hypothetical protein
VSLAWRFPRFYASPPSSLEFGRFWDWIGLDWIGLDWIGLDWIGLDWIGLDWIGLDWIGLDWIDGIGHLSLARCFPRFYASPPSPLEFGAFLKSGSHVLACMCRRKCRLAYLMCWPVLMLQLPLKCTVSPLECPSYLPSTALPPWAQMR